MQENVNVIKGHYKCLCGNTEPIKIHNYPRSNRPAYFTFVCTKCGLYIDSKSIAQLYQIVKLEKD